MNHRLIVSLVVAGVVVIGGWFVLFGLQEGVNNGNTVGDLSLSRTEPDTSQPGFQFEGRVGFTVDPTAIEDNSFEGVELCMYDVNGRVLISRTLGTFSGSSAYRNISVNLNAPPRYVLVHHPNFYEIDGYGGFDIEVLEYIPNEGRYIDSAPGALPFDHEKIPHGSCRPST